MNLLEKLPKESNEKYGTRLGGLAAENLQGVTEENQIREITLKYWEPIVKTILTVNSRKTPRSAFVKEIEKTFPSSNEPKAGYYRTNAGRGKGERYEHLALWYASNSEDERRIKGDIVGDQARADYWKNLKPYSKETTEQLEKQPEPESELKAKLEPEEPKPEPEEPKPEPEEPKPEPEVTKLKIQNMTIELDTKTQELISDALKYSDQTLAEFTKKAFEMYANTLIGKANQHDDDLSAVPTKELLDVTKKDENGNETRNQYFTHRGRAKELTKRAIVAIQRHNDKATEKDQKWMITQTTIQALIGSKPKTIGDILDKKEDENEQKGILQKIIDRHNEKHDLKPYDNRKGSKRKVDEEIILKDLVPDGLDLQVI